MSLHFAKVKNSPRLQRTLSVLLDHHPHTTRHIQEKAHVCAVNSIVSELRANGYVIDCECIGRGRFQYQLN